MSTDYEIKLIKADGTTGMFHVMSSQSDADARKKALALFTRSFERYEIWRGAVCMQRGSREDE